MHLETAGGCRRYLSIRVHSGPFGASGLLLAEDGIEIAKHFRRGPVLGAHEFAHEFAVAVDNVGVREEIGAVVQGDFAGGVAESGEGDAVIDEKFLVRGVVFIDAHAEHDTAARSDVLVQPLQGGSFFDTRRAPGGPEIQHDDLAAEVGELARFAGNAGRKIASRFTVNGSFALAVARKNKGDQGGGNQRDHRPSRNSAENLHRLLY